MFFLFDGWNSFLSEQELGVHGEHHIGSTSWPLRPSGSHFMIMPHGKLHAIMDLVQLVGGVNDSDADD